MVVSQKINLAEIVSSLAGNLSAEEIQRIRGFIEGMIAGKEMTQRAKLT